MSFSMVQDYEWPPNVSEGDSDTDARAWIDRLRRYEKMFRGREDLRVAYFKELEASAEYITRGNIYFTGGELEERRSFSSYLARAASEYDRYISCESLGNGEEDTLYFPDDLINDEDLEEG